MNPLTYIQNMTSEDVQRYVRIALQWLASSLVTYGYIKPGATWVPQAIGAAVGLASLIWTLYGNRIVAKLNEIAKTNGGKIVVVTTPELADATPASPNVVANTDVKVVSK